MTDGRTTQDAVRALERIRAFCWANRDAWALTEAIEMLKDTQEDITMNEFERVSSETMETNGSDMRENCIYWTNGDKYATVNFTQVKYITRVKKLAEQFPDEVKIKSERNGVLIATVPTSFVKVSKKIMSEESAQRLRERFKNERSVDEF